MNLKINRLSEVLDKSGNRRSTLYSKIKKGLWPKPIRLGQRSVGWPDHEIGIVNAAYIAGKSIDEIRALVAQLEYSRKSILVGGLQ